MRLDGRFWLAFAVFEVGFGLLVFGITRSYYVGKVASAEAAAADAQAASEVADAAAVADDETWSESITPELVATLTGTEPDTNDPSEIAQRANDAFNAGNYDRAAQYYERLLAFDTTNSDVRNNLALTLQYLGRTDEALANLEANVERDPGHQRSWLTIGYVSRQAGDLARAREALKNAVDLDPDSDVGRSAAAMLEELPSGD